VGGEAREGKGKDGLLLRVNACGVISLLFPPAARSFGAAVVAGRWTDHWLYWVAPAVGSIFGAGVFLLVFNMAGQLGEMAADNLPKSLGGSSGTRQGGRK